MRTTLALLAAASVLLVGACKVNPLSVGDKKELVCSAAQTWIDADPAVKRQVSGELSGAVDDAESSTKPADRSDGLTTVLGAARDLLSGNGVDTAAQRIDDYC